MSHDDEIQALARAREATPDDPVLALKHARALARSGDASGAEAILVARLDVLPGHKELTAALDEITRGRRIGAPWPSSRGDAARTARSCAIGPTRGEIVARVDLDFEGEGEGLAVDESGLVLTCMPGFLIWFDEKGQITRDEELPGGFDPRSIVLLPGERTLLQGGTQALVLAPGKPRVPRRYPFASSSAVGSSGILHVATQRDQVLALTLGAPAEARPIARTEPGVKVGLAIAPGGDLVVVAWGDPDRHLPATIRRYSSEGDLESERSLEALTSGAISQPVVSSEGTVFIDFPGRAIVAHDASGERVFSAPWCGMPAGLGGAMGEILLIHDIEGIAFLDARTGKLHAKYKGPRWSLPKVDARGWIYAKRGDDLVAWDPLKLDAPAFEVMDVMPRTWDFAFAGNGRIFAVLTSRDVNRLVVIE